MKKLRIPISFKLIGITTILLLTATVPVAYRSAAFFESNSRDREEYANIEHAKSRADEVEGLLISYLDKVKVIASLLQKGEGSNDQKEMNLDLTFRRDRDLVSVEVYTENSDTPVAQVVNEDYLKQYKLDRQYIRTLREHQQKSKRFNKASVFLGEIEIRNGSLESGAPLISLAVPFVKDDSGKITHIAISEIRLDRLQKIFSNISDRTLYMVDKEGYLLTHSDKEHETDVLAAKEMTLVPVVKSAVEMKLGSKGQVHFKDGESGESFLGAYARTSLGVSVIAQASEDVILENARLMKSEGFHFAGRILSVALFLIFLFSITLTSPIERLVEVAQQIAKGNFNVKSQVHSTDEVGDLARAFDQMTEGLKERDKMKNVLSKFHGSSVAEDLIQGNLSLGGSKKEVTVFFSDIRDFTKFSEKNDAETVVDMLNEYFQVMVSIINQNGGVVDKFIGDAIMAVWGVPKASPEDAQNAVTASLQMRKALVALNEQRDARGESPLKFGIGLHSGAVISGNIGSSERMEYTIIGDTVNQASRIEGSTKAFGADLIISAATAEAVKGKFIIEKAGDVEVKGKAEPLSLFKVRGYIDEQGLPVLVQTKYSDYESGHADKVKMVS